MEIIGQSKLIRISPRKLRLVAQAVSRLALTEAMVVLENLDKSAAKPILLTFKQAVANAVNNFGLVKESLAIKEIQVSKGPILKGWRAVSRGRAHQINKRTSHLRIILEGKKKEELKPVTEEKPSRRQPRGKSRSLLTRVKGQKKSNQKE